MGTKQNPGVFDCYHEAAPDEPMFVLLARDPNAPNVVREWAWKYFDRKCKAHEYDQHACDKYVEAMLVADEMDAWRKQREALTAATKATTVIDTPKRREYD